MGRVDSKLTVTFLQKVFPFGATAAVYGFNWVARALWRILVIEFGLVLVHYFDDFTFVAPAAIAESMIDHAKAGLDLLGWTRT